MANEYTDVDRLILSRWQEVRGLIEAYEDVQDRIEEVIDGVAARLSTWLGDRGYDTHWDAKSPTIYIGRPSWDHRRKDDWLVYFEISDFAPHGYRKVSDDHPYAVVRTQNLSFLRMKDAEREAFGRALRQELGPAAAVWQHRDAIDSDCPLIRDYKEIDEVGRIELIANPDKLFDFTTRVCEDLFSLSETIDSLLAKRGVSG